MPADTRCSVGLNKEKTKSVENCDKAEIKSLTKARKSIKTLFYWQTCGLVLALSSVLSVQMLQTSINIKDHVGSISVSAGFATSIFFCLFVCPTLLHKFGPNASLVLSEVCYLVYCLSNFYPELYILVPGAMISGIGRALFVPSYSMLIITLATHCAEYTKTKPGKYYFNLFQSWFYSLNELVQIIGNGLSYAILYAGSQPHQENKYASSRNKTLHNVTDQESQNLYLYCGVNDCQDSNVIKDSIDQYVPPNKTSLNLFISTAALLAVLAILIHWFIYPGIGIFSNKLARIKNNFESIVSSEEGSLKSRNSKDITCLVPAASSGEGESYSTNSSRDDTIEYLSTNNNEKEFETGDFENVEKLLDANENKTTKIRYSKTLKSTMHLLIEPRSLLLSISTLHHGMMIGFAFADLTRAYASCVAGVQYTGAFAAAFGVSGMVSAYLYGKILPFLGRHCIYCISIIIELAVYILCYRWVPDPDTIGVVLVIFIGIGLTNGLFRQNIIAAYTIHFPKNKSIALTVFNIWWMGGMGVQYGLSTIMCVNEKLYTQVAVMAVGLIFYAIVEILRVKENKERRLSDANISSSENPPVII